MLIASILTYSLINPVLFWLVLVPLAIFFGVGSVMGAPYLPVRRDDADAILDLLDLKKGEVLLDLGAGDGKLLRAAAKRGIRGIGYEINPVLFAWSWILCWPKRKLISLHLGNYWNQTLPQADGVYVFMIEHYMSKLERKLQQDLNKPTKVASYIFKLPHAKPVKSLRNAFLYEIGG